jgi:hypothetical protein
VKKVPWWVKVVVCPVIGASLMMTGAEVAHSGPPPQPPKVCIELLA